jgi:hypothetical protein
MEMIRKKLATPAGPEAGDAGAMDPSPSTGAQPPDRNQLVSLTRQRVLPELPTDTTAPLPAPPGGRGPNRRTALLAGGLLLAGAVAGGLVAFQPWRLWTVRTVSEPLPATGPTAPSAPAGPASGPASASASSPAVAPASGGATAAPSAAPPAGPVTVAAGGFRSLAHDTTGRARVLRLADGSQVLRIEDLATSDGPDVRVWLSAQPADRAADAGGAARVELGRLRGNRGDLSYPIPAGTDLRDYGSVVIWCKRFSVAFGAAPLTPA